MSIKPLTPEGQYIYVNCSSNALNNLTFLFGYVNTYGVTPAYIYILTNVFQDGEYLINLSVSINSKSALSTLSINLLKISQLTISLPCYLSMQQRDISCIAVEQ